MTSPCTLQRELSYANLMHHFNAGQDTSGGGADFVGRVLGGKLTNSLGQPVVVDSRTGGVGLIGHEIVAKATPDGNTESPRI